MRSNTLREVVALIHLLIGISYANSDYDSRTISIMLYVIIRCHTVNCTGTAKMCIEVIGVKSVVTSYALSRSCECSLPAEQLLRFVKILNVSTRLVFLAKFYFDLKST